MMFTIQIDDDLELALVEPSFASQYLNIITNDREHLRQWLPWVDFCHDKKAFSDFIQKSLLDYAQGTSLTCAIILQGKLVGNISFNSINQSLEKVEIGYWLSSQHQGKGIMRRAVTKFIELAFTHYGMTKVEISAAEENQRSRHVCECLGFKLEGVIRQAERVNGHLLNHAVYGLHKSEWSMI